MTAATRFEDLVAWQKAHVLTREVYEATKSNSFQRDFSLSNQIQRAAVSVMANIAEGFDRNRPREFHQFLSQAKASCAEVRSHLYVAVDCGYLTAPQFERLMAYAIEVARVVNGLRAAVEGRKNPSRSN